eukprot:5469580-Prymnesium_polylepis.1
MLHRAKRNPGTFMMRLRVTNGIVTSEQMRFYADSVEPYGPDVGVIDVTTRQNIQLRGISLEGGADVIDGLHVRLLLLLNPTHSTPRGGNCAPTRPALSSGRERGLVLVSAAGAHQIPARTPSSQSLNQTCIQTGLDNIRNMVGNPLAGIDEHELVDTRPYTNMLNDLVRARARVSSLGFAHALPATGAPPEIAAPRRVNARSLLNCPQGAVLSRSAPARRA